MGVPIGGDSLIRTVGDLGGSDKNGSMNVSQRYLSESRRSFVGEPSRKRIDMFRGYANAMKDSQKSVRTGSLQQGSYSLRRISVRGSRQVSVSLNESSRFLDEPILEAETDEQKTENLDLLLTGEFKKQEEDPVQNLSVEIEASLDPLDSENDSVEFAFMGYGFSGLTAPVKDQEATANQPDPVKTPKPRDRETLFKKVFKEVCDDYGKGQEFDNLSDLDLADSDQDSLERGPTNDPRIPD